MGSGSWTTQSFVDYSTKTNKRVNTSTGALDSSYTAQDLFTASGLQKELNPKNVIRECCDSEEHPNTIPVILALDVTGSMGAGAAMVAKKLNLIMTELYEKVQDVEFMVMGIGDLAYDRAPLQASQFESDIRIAEQLDKIYFERGGGGNGFESYTAAWYFALNHTKLDCWERGKKGIIITMGDECLNPYLPKEELAWVTGDNLEGNVETELLFDKVTKYFDVYHLAIDDVSTSWTYYKKFAAPSFKKYLDDEHFKEVTLDNLTSTIVNIVTNQSSNSETTEKNYTNQGISW